MSLSALLDSPLVMRLGWAILHSLWEILAVALVLALVLPVLRRSGPRAAYAGCCLALVLSLTLPTMTFFMRPASPPGALPTAARELAGSGTPIGGQSLNAGQSPIAGDQTLISPAGADLQANREVVLQASEAAPLQDRVADLYRRASASIVAWVPWLVVVWTVGVLGLSIWNCAGWLAVLRLKSTGTSQVPRQVEEAAVRLAQRLGLARTVRLLQSALVESPVVIGAWKPVILLPAALALQIAPDQLEALLAHELAHVLRRDYLVNLLQTAVETLLFYHPGVWWISAQVRRERENCCDDLALRLASDRAVYVKALAAVAGARAPSMVPAASGGQLLARLHRILGISRPERGHPARWLTGVAMLSLCGIVAALSTEPARTTAADPEPPVQKSPFPETPAAEPAAEETPPAAAETVGMLCVDAEGKPVTGAEVYLFQNNAAARFEQFGPFTSDEQGKAVCAKAVFTNDNGEFDRWIYARVPGRLVGVARFAKWPNWHAFNIEGRVKLQASRSVAGQVTVPVGFDCAHVTVRARVLRVGTGPGHHEFEEFPRLDLFPGLDTALPGIFERHPDASGRIQFDDVPLRGWLFLVSNGDGLAESQWTYESETPDKPIQLTIEEECRISGRVLTPDGKPAAGLRIAARISDSNASRGFISSTFRTVTDESGAFLIDGLPNVEIDLYVEDPLQRWTLRPLEEIVVQPGEVQNVEIKMEKGVLVSGRVVDPEGNPVTAVGISVVTLRAGGSPRGLAGNRTDATGGYQLRVPSGGAHVHFSSVLGGFVYPKPNIIKFLDVQPGDADIEVPDFTLQREPVGEP